jgi:hypothetical protein
MTTYDLPAPLQFRGVSLADTCRVLRWLRATCPQLLEVIEAHTARELTYENCDGLGAFIFWTHLELSHLNDSAAEPIFDEVYQRWPLFVRQFYAEVWRQLQGA